MGRSRGEREGVRGSSEEAARDYVGESETQGTDQ